MARSERQDLYQLITDAVIAELGKGRIPWEKPWNAPGTGARSVGTGKLYQGVNSLFLGLAPYASPWFLTLKNARKLGGSVLSDQRKNGHHVVFWKFIEKKDENDQPILNSRGDVEKFALLRSHTVFNLEQCELPDEVIERLADRLKRLAGDAPEPGEALDPEAVKTAQAILEAYDERENIEVKIGGGQASYQPAGDFIRLPDPSTFSLPEHYLHTGAHERVHSTGHKSRLARGFEKVQNFSKHAYSREELVAELGASFLGGVLGFEREEVAENRNAYIQSWLRALKDDPKQVVWAAGKAQKAADLILGNPEQKGEAEEALAYRR